MTTPDSVKGLLSALALVPLEIGEVRRLVVVDEHEVHRPGAKPVLRTPASSSPLQGEDTPELLLEAVANGSRKARFPWPERDLAFLATGLLTGLARRCSAAVASM